MEVKILGFKKYDFTNDSGERVRGMSVFVSHADANAVGEVATKISISNPQLWQQLVDLAGGKDYLPGFSCIFHFNMKGKYVGASAL